MTQSPLALKRRREAERPPGIPNTKKQNNEAKDKKSSSIGSGKGHLIVYVIHQMSCVLNQEDKRWRKEVLAQSVM